MKIKLKREQAKEAVKGDKSKEAIGDQTSVVELAWPAEEEEEDILKPYYAYLTPTEIEAFRIIETVRVQNKYLTCENNLHQEHEHKHYILLQQKLLPYHLLKLLDHFHLLKHFLSHLL